MAGDGGPIPPEATGSRVTLRVRGSVPARRCSLYSGRRGGQVGRPVSKPLAGTEISLHAGLS
jgi:hypothetical protein